MKSAAKAVVILGLIARGAVAQCGPGGAKPYPPGETTCPELAEGMEGHEDDRADAPGAIKNDDIMEGICVTPPCAASMLGSVGYTTVQGTDVRSGITLSAGEDIYGPFENGFGTRQDTILGELGCIPGSKGHVNGGIDTDLAQQLVAFQCGVTLPRVEGNTYISLLDECGGHTKEYHFHQRLSCLYKLDGGHSTQVGKGQDEGRIYGKWENFNTSTLPLLDACGGHIGFTPDSPTIAVYHYHVQDRAPFVIGCFGPHRDAEGNDNLVTVPQCRALYSGCHDGDEVTLTTASGETVYDPWCPCYDADGFNSENCYDTSKPCYRELPVFSTLGATLKCVGGCSDFDPTNVDEQMDKAVKRLTEIMKSVGILLALGCCGCCTCVLCIYLMVKK